MPDENPIALQGLDHVVLRTARLNTMIAFYRDTLGCPIERSLETMGLYQLRAGSSLIDIVDCDAELGRIGGAPPGLEGRNMDHFCLQVEPWDAAAILAHLRERGVNAGDPTSRYGAEGQGPSIYLQDPDGNTVELKGPPIEA